MNRYGFAARTGATHFFEPLTERCLCCGGDRKDARTNRCHGELLMREYLMIDRSVVWVRQPLDRSRLRARTVDRDPKSNEVGE